ncbi:NosR/NirI family protein [Aliigemmobacter aestuarii]|nr:NosR/NirI family protein [Gemmobacter aestuarii]
MITAGLRLIFILLLGLMSLQPFGTASAEGVAAEAPDRETVAALVGLSGPLTLQRIDEGIPGWTVLKDGRIVAHLGSTWEIAGSVGYSGRPIDVLLAISPDARVIGARLLRHNEPVLTLGISDADITAYVEGFVGLDLANETTGAIDAALPDIISRATVSTGVLRDSILRTARILAVGRGVISGGAVDRTTFEVTDWAGLLAMGALAETRVTMTEAAEALAGAKVAVTPSDQPFLHLWTGVIDTPTVGANLLGNLEFGRAMGGIGPRDSALLIASSGLFSPRGTDWKKTGVFERITVVQGDRRWQPDADAFRSIKKLVLADAPEMKEISVFALPPAIDPARPVTIEVQVTRPKDGGGEVGFTVALPYALPDAFRAATAEPEALWRQIWEDKRPQTVLVGLMLVVLAVILFAQEAITRRPRLWRGLRLGFLGVSFFVLGLGLNGQLSVVQVIAFLHSLLGGFRWETFLIEPVIFLLWSFTALGLLFWGRGVYCGWLCPFGALQELMNAAARRFGIRQIAVPQSLHERLWAIKYTLFVAIVALSFYSMHDALVMAEVEPFKTAISMRFMRAWPFLLFVAAILFMGLFIERFYCRYLCPLGAGLAIPAKLKIFDWLHRRPQCGRECRLCETQCTVGAIDAIGRINPNECVLCLRCQVTMNDATQCPVLKRRARTQTESATP